jgi:hypothetical protein
LGNMGPQNKTSLSANAFTDSKGAEWMQARSEALSRQGQPRIAQRFQRWVADEERLSPERDG